jgi:hypothetical protein
MAGVERFSKTARQYDSGKSPTLDPTTDAVKKLSWVRQWGALVVVVVVVVGRGGGGFFTQRPCQPLDAPCG